VFFRFERCDSLPGLAWCCRLRRGRDEVRVQHGRWVELREDAFFEGAWDGPFDGEGPEDAVSFAGTGARLRDGSVVFASATNPHDRLYLIDRGPELVVSNSLVFALQAAGDEPAPEYRYYGDRVLRCIRAGIRSEASALPTRDGEVRMVTCGNVVVGRDLSRRRCEKPEPPAPDGFEGYVAMLAGSMRRLFANAADPRRIVRHRPLAPLSQGYDGNAVAALAARLGCREAYTFTPPLFHGRAGGDDGSLIGERLGLSVTARPLDAWAQATAGFPEAEFCVHPHGGDVTLAGIEDLLPGRLLLTGRPGDGLWDSQLRDLGPELQRTGWSGASGWTMSEFRLRVGFIHYAPVFTGWQHVDRLHALSRSSEMRAWSVGGDYDRPIPRRILEEAGVPRELFGSCKVRGGVHVLRWSNALCPRSRSDFAAWLRSKPLLARLRLRASRLGHRASRRVRRSAHSQAPPPERGRDDAVDPGRRERPYLSDGFLVHWGFAHTRERYRDAHRSAAA
jgi:hypothetical protein